MRSPLSYHVYPCEGNLLDDPGFQEWINDLGDEERDIHREVAINFMLMEREPPYEIDIVTGKDA